MAGALAGEFVEQRVRIITLDRDLAIQGEGDLEVSLTEFLDGLLGGRLLSAEVVAGESGDDESLRLMALIQRLQAGILPRVAALAGDIDDEPGLASLDRAERGGLTIDVLHRHGEQTGRGFLGRSERGEEKQN